MRINFRILNFCFLILLATIGECQKWEKILLNPEDSYGSNPLNFITMGDKLFFNARDAIHGVELWVSDGTQEGTYLLKDMSPRDNNIATNMIVHNGLLFFIAEDHQYKKKLWQTDGTVEGTKNPDMFRYNSILYYPHLSFKDKLILTEKDYKEGTYATDGTHKGEIRIGPIGESFFAYDDYFLFTSNDGTELWKSDGTDTGTSLLIQIETPIDRDRIRILTSVGNKVLLNIPNTKTRKFELWATEGSRATTYLIKAVEDNGPNHASHIINYHGLAFLKAISSEGKFGLWATNGEKGDIRFIKEIDVTGFRNDDNYKNSVTIFNDLIYFSAYQEKNGIEMWVSNGTTEGTRLFQDINSEYHSYPLQFNVVGDKFYFLAYDNQRGLQLREINKQIEGSLVIQPPLFTSYTFDAHTEKWFEGVGRIDNSLFFSAKYGAEKYDLWKFTPSIKEVNFSAFEIFPNPFNDYLQVLNKSSQSEEIKVYDNLGRIMLKRVVGGYDSDILSLSGFREGLYYLILNNGSSYKILKQ